MRKHLVFFFAISILNCNHPESRNYERHKGHDTPSSDEISYEENQTGYKVIGIKDFYELSKSIFTSFLSCRNAVINKRLPILYNSKGT